MAVTLKVDTPAAYNTRQYWLGEQPSSLPPQGSLRSSAEGVWLAAHRMLIHPLLLDLTVPAVQRVLVEALAYASGGAQVRFGIAREPLPKSWNGSDHSLLVSTVQPPIKNVGGA